MDAFECELRSLRKDLAASQFIDNTVAFGQPLPFHNNTGPQGNVYRHLHR
jgi:hypothetical protein